MATKVARVGQILERPWSGMPQNRTYQFTITVTIDEDHVAFDDPEWVADAAWGALTNEYGPQRHLHGNIENVEALS